MKTWKLISLIVVALIIGVALGIGYTKTFKKVPAQVDSVTVETEQAKMLDVKVEVPAKVEVKK